MVLAAKKRMASIDNVDLKVNRLNRGGKTRLLCGQLSYTWNFVSFFFSSVEKRCPPTDTLLCCYLVFYFANFFFSSAFQKSQTWEQCKVNPAKYFTSWESYAKSTDRELDTVGLWAMNGEQWNLKFFGVRFVHWNIILFIYSKIAIVQ